MTEPENDTEEAPEDEGAEEEQACLRYPYDPNQEQTEHNYQADWMTRKETCTKSPVRKNIIWVRFVIWSPDFASSTTPKLSWFRHRLPYTPATPDWANHSFLYIGAGHMPDLRRYRKCAIPHSQIVRYPSLDFSMMVEDVPDPFE